jgi:ankyrin repeat protein
MSTEAKFAYACSAGRRAIRRSRRVGWLMLPLVLVTVQSAAYSAGLTAATSARALWRTAKDGAELIGMRAQDIDPITGESLKGLTPLMLAARKGSDSAVSTLLAGGADPKERGPSGESVLIFAAKSCKVETVELLLNRGLDVNTLDYYFSPLSAAAERGRLSVVRLLLERGAKVDTCGRDGYTPLTLAAIGGHRKVMRLLFRHGAKARNNGPKSPLLTLMDEDDMGHSQRSYDIDSLRMLLDHGADIESYGEGYRTPLAHAVHLARVDAIKELLKRGADPNGRLVDGKTPLDEILEVPAARRGPKSVEMERILRVAGGRSSKELRSKRRSR